MQMKSSVSSLDWEQILKGLLREEKVTDGFANRSSPGEFAFCAYFELCWIEVSAV
jgi:hypothetical protein